VGEIVIKFMDEADLKRIGAKGDEAMARLVKRAERRWWQFWKP
jgi:hypothetical protein